MKTKLTKPKKKKAPQKVCYEENTCPHAYYNGISAFTFFQTHEFIRCNICGITFRLRDNISTSLPLYTYCNKEFLDKMLPVPYKEELEIFDLVVRKRKYHFKGKNYQKFCTHTDIHGWYNLRFDKTCNSDFCKICGKRLSPTNKFSRPRAELIRNYKSCLYKTREYTYERIRGKELKIVRNPRHMFITRNLPFRKSPNS